jgi:protein SCO1/2
MVRKNSIRVAGWLRQWALLTLACCLLLTAVGCGGPSFKGKARQPLSPAPDFTLTDQHGRPFRLSEQKGNVVLLYFGYTYCPDVCPTTLGDFKRLHKLLGDKAARVRFVFVTADPERDTPERLKKYLDIFNPDFLGLVGTEAELQDVYSKYDIFVQKEEVKGSAAEYLVSHTASVTLIDPDGNWRLIYDFGTPPEDMAADIEKLL